jgi:hypothetical protein
MTPTERKTSCVRRPKLAAVGDRFVWTPPANATHLHPDWGIQDLPDYAGVARQNGGDVWKKSSAIHDVIPNTPGLVAVFLYDPSSGLAEILALVMLTLMLRWGILNPRHLALTSFRDGFSRWALFSFRAGMASFLFELVGLSL